MFTVSTIGREFALNLELAKQHIEDNYGFKVLSPFSSPLKGDVNINFVLDTSVGKKIVRFYGAYSQFTKQELEIMQFLADQGFPTSRPLRNTHGDVVTDYEGYEYSVFDFLVGQRPLYTPEAFFRVGSSVARLQKLLQICPVKLNRENRFLQLFNRKDQLAQQIEQNLDTVKAILAPDVFATIPEQIDMFRHVTIPTTNMQLIHGDIYNTNVIDNGQEAAIIDFEWIAHGPAVIDPLLYVAWDGVSNSRTANTPSIYRERPSLLTDQIRAYFEGFKKAEGDVSEFKTPHLVDLLVFMNIGDSMFNLEIAINAGQNLFQDYTNNFNSGKLIQANRIHIQQLLSDL